MKVSIFRKEHFNAAHRLFNKNWTEEQNLAIFGLCSNPLYHGHNYELEVKVTGNVNPETGFVINLDTLKSIIKTEVLLPFDHKNLNLQVAEFNNLNPTAENIAIVIWQRLRIKLPNNFNLLVRLYETPRNFVEYEGN